MKRLKIPKLRDKVWRMFSLYIRLSEANSDGYVKCVTCGKKIKAAGENECQAGHFKHGKSQECYFDERNVWPQCIDCNHFHKTRAQQEYTLFLVEKYGSKVVKDLLESKKVAWKREHLEDLYEVYKKKVEALQ